MIIGLTGYKQSGKSVASKHLQEKYGYKPHNFKDALVKELKENFPDLLNEIMENHNNYHHRDYPYVGTINSLFEEKPPLVRKLLQNYGTEVRRKDDKNYWVVKWSLGLSGIMTKNIVVDDVRFLNEAGAVKDCGGIIIKIIRTGQVSNDNHTSETEHNQIKPDFIIEVGDGEQEEMYKQLDKIIDNLNK